LAEGQRVQHRTVSSNHPVEPTVITSLILARVQFPTYQVAMKWAEQASVPLAAKPQTLSSAMKNTNILSGTPAPPARSTSTRPWVNEI